jgi:Tfp pilus assembly protein PilV
LVEVLVATAVLAIGLLAALAAFSMASRVAGASRNDTMVMFLAQQKLAEVQLVGPQDLGAGTARGDFGPEFPGYTWRLKVSPPRADRVISVDLVISAPEAGRTREVRFSTAVF